MRVLAITHSLGSNGAALCLCRVLMAVKAAGGSADVIYEGNEFWVQELRDHGVGVITQAQTADYDVALVNTLTDYHRVAPLAAALPVVFWVHEGQSNVDLDAHLGPAWQKAFERSARIVFSSEVQSEVFFKPWLLTTDARRVMHVAPGIALSAPELAANRGPRNAGAIISVGSVYPRKRPADLVHAVTLLETPGVHCTLAGSLNWLALNGTQMQQHLAAYPDRFTLTGEIPHAEKLAHLARSSVFCSASSDETFNMAAMEAASMGLALALSDLPCYAGVWKHGVHALMAPIGAVDCLAWNLRALTQDPALAARLGRAAQETAQQFTLERFVRGMSAALVGAAQATL